MAKIFRITWYSIQAIETIYYLSYSDGLHPSNTPLPSYVSGYPASRVSSACSCLVTPATVTGHPVPGYQFYVSPTHFRTVERPGLSRHSFSIFATHPNNIVKHRRLLPPQRRPPSPYPPPPPFAPIHRSTARLARPSSPRTKCRARIRPRARPPAARPVTAIPITKTVSHGLGLITHSCVSSMRKRRATWQRNVRLGHKASRSSRISALIRMGITRGERGRAHLSSMM